VTLVFHNFWAAAADQQQIELAMFMKNIAMMGGLLYIMAYGSGRFSVKA
jgi:putative oxidoreductase